MSSTKSLTPMALSALGQKLREAPPIKYDPFSGERALTRLESVALLRDDIMAMRDKGYRVVEVAEFLSKNGLRISAAALYATMCRLNCSLARPHVSVAHLITAHLEAAGAAPTQLPLADIGSSDTISAAKIQARAVERQKSIGPDMVKIQLKAQKLLKNLKPREVAIFHQLLTQLTRGSQCVELNAQLADSGAKLMELGLLRKFGNTTDHSYEVPFDVARIGPIAKLETSYRGD